MQIRKLLSKLFVCIMGVFVSCSIAFAASNTPKTEISNQGNWLNAVTIQQFHKNIENDFQNFTPKINTDEKTFVPIEARIGLMFMKALSSIDHVLQISLVRFVIIFLLIMYGFWIAMEAYKMIRDSTDYKTVFFNIFKQGITIAVWVIILNYGPHKIFSMIVSPILFIGTYLSDLILNATVGTYKVNIPDTCTAIHNYVVTNTDTNKILIDADTVANIMCLPSRISVFFYKAVLVGFQWIKQGFTSSITMVVTGITSVVLFIMCIFKFVFMTLGVIVDLFLTLLLLPFTAIAEAMPTTNEKNLAGQVLSGFLKIFKTKKVSDVILVFINAALYFISLSIIIAICTALLSNIVYLTEQGTYTTSSAITIILTACLIFYIAGKSDELSKKLGGSIDNTVGKELATGTRLAWNNVKGMVSNVAKKLATKSAK